MESAFHKLEEKFEEKEAQLEAKLGLSSRETQTSSENKALFLWNKYEGEEAPNTFSFLQLAKDGGFSEVKELYNHARWISAFILLFFVAYNVPSVAYQDYQFLTDLDGAVATLSNDTSVKAQLEDKFYFSRGMTDKMCEHFGRDKVSPLKVISGLELIFLCYYVLNMIFNCIAIYFGSGYRKWFAVQDIFFQIFPILSVYSAMRLLYCIVPLVLISDIFAYIAWSKEVREEKSKTLFVVILFWIAYVVQIIFSVIVGFDTFLMKLRIIAVVVKAKDLNGNIALKLVQFFSQVIGIVSMGRFVMRRLFVFHIRWGRCNLARRRRGSDERVECSPCPTGLPRSPSISGHRCHGKFLR
jgi:hypothetical protein